MVVERLLSILVRFVFYLHFGHDEDMNARNESGETRQLCIAAAAVATAATAANDD